MKSPTVGLVILSLMSVVASAAGDEPSATAVRLGVGSSTGGAEAADAVNFLHHDCVGLGLLVTAPPHATHTQNIPGFVLDPARGITVEVDAFTLFGPGGICPTPLGGDALSEDFTGHWRLVLVCRETLNPGVVTLDWNLDFVAGLVTKQTVAGDACVDFLNNPFSLDATVSISGTTFLGLPLPPVGGIRLTVSQP